MTRYILRRLALLPIGIALANFFSFAYAHFALPHQLALNPFNATVLDEVPLATAYGAYLAGVMRGDLGRLPGAGGDVWGTLVSAAGASLGLLAIAMTLSIIFGLLLGMRAARHDPPRVATWLTFTSTLGLAMPSFYIGMLFIVGSILYAIRGTYATEPPFPLQGFGWDAHMILPVLVLTARPTMEIAQVMAGTMVSELDKQYVVSARALGHTWRGVRWRHVFRNVLATMIVSMSRSFRLLVGELILVEFLFSWPGLGRLLARTLTPSQLTNAAGPLFLNAPLIAGTVTLLTALFLFSEFASNILMHYFDPRLTSEEAAPNG